MDVTLLYRSVGHVPYGPLRVERCIVQAALKITDIEIDYCYYDKRTKAYYTASASDVEFAITYANPLHIRRLAGHRNALRDIWEFATSRSLRRYCISFRWNLRRFMPIRLLSRRLNENYLDAGTIYILIDIPNHVSAIADLKRRTQISLLFMCHDVIPVLHPEYFEENAASWFQEYIQTMLTLADGVVAVSNCTRRDTETYAKSVGLRLPPASVIQLGTEISGECPIRRPDNLPPLENRGYILCVGNINVRKNHELLYQLWARNNARDPRRLPPLVIVGDVGWRVENLMAHLRTDPQIRNSIVLLHHIDDKGLAWLYDNCKFTVYPSLYEGWGLPVSESLAHGKYCLASSSSSLPEAGAGFAGLIDPNDLEAWEQAIFNLIDNPEELDRLEKEIVNGYRPVTWQNAADEFFACVRTIDMPSVDALLP